ncbi:hypothetical protein LS71_008290 [Helicobacter jaachi]|uniref:Uncharacterized protein n=1 Tax=Helicobacter jaachi TaxID=1677920 RepID=A0A4U8T706_9HELI|nr:hypothetical protein [Helicobacter jaachi]TLD95396.1 hypothetical protein LS71_008290 [Helicobacter jaachi]
MPIRPIVTRVLNIFFKKDKQESHHNNQSSPQNQQDSKRSGKDFATILLDIQSKEQANDKANTHSSPQRSSSHTQRGGDGENHSNYLQSTQSTYPSQNGGGYSSTYNGSLTGIRKEESRRSTEEGRRGRKATTRGVAETTNDVMQTLLIANKYRDKDRSKPYAYTIFNPTQENFINDTLRSDIFFNASIAPLRFADKIQDIEHNINELGIKQTLQSHITLNYTRILKSQEQSHKHTIQSLYDDLVHLNPNIALNYLKQTPKHLQPKPIKAHAHIINNHKHTPKR